MRSDSTHTHTHIHTHTHTRTHPHTPAHTRTHPHAHLWVLLLKHTVLRVIELALSKYLMFYCLVTYFVLLRQITIILRPRIDEKVCTRHLLYSWQRFIDSLQTPCKHMSILNLKETIDVCLNRVIVFSASQVLRIDKYESETTRSVLRVMLSWLLFVTNSICEDLLLEGSGHLT